MERRNDVSATVLPAFHDTDIDTDILARILADTSDTRDFLKLFLWQAERGSRQTRRHPRATIIARMSARMSVSVSWNAALCTQIKRRVRSLQRQVERGQPLEPSQQAMLGYYTALKGNMEADDAMAKDVLVMLMRMNASESRFKNSLESVLRTRGFVQ